jgi:hypothetical protein
MLGGGVFTVKLIPSIAELTRHDRNRCVVSSLSISLRPDSHVPFATKVVIKAERRCENMVCIHHVLAERK